MTNLSVYGDFSVSGDQDVEVDVSCQFVRGVWKDIPLLLVPWSKDTKSISLATPAQEIG